MPKVARTSSWRQEQIAGASYHLQNACVLKGVVCSYVQTIITRKHNADIGLQKIKEEKEGEISRLEQGLMKVTFSGIAGFEFESSEVCPLSNGNLIKKLVPCYCNHK